MHTKNTCGDPIRFKETITHNADDTASEEEREEKWKNLFEQSAKVQLHPRTIYRNCRFQIQLFERQRTTIFRQHRNWYHQSSKNYKPTGETIKSTMDFCNCLSPYYRQSRCKLKKDQSRIGKILKVWKEAPKLNTTRTSSVHTLSQEKVSLSEIEEILLAESLSNTNSAPLLSSSPLFTTAFAEEDVDLSQRISSLFNDIYFYSVT